MSIQQFAILVPSQENQIPITFNHSYYLIKRWHFWEESLYKKKCQYKDWFVQKTKYAKVHLISRRIVFE